MNRKCKAKTKAGTRCRGVAVKDGPCALHSDPGRAAELGRKSGKARRRVVQEDDARPALTPPRAAQEVRDLIGQAMSDVHGRRMDTRIANALGYLATVLVKAIEVSDIEVRLQALEQQRDDIAKEPFAKVGACNGRENDRTVQP